MGIISSIGSTVDETLHALQNRYSNMHPVRRFDTTLKHIPVCEVPYSNEELRSRLPFLHSGKIYSRTSLLGLIAAHQAVKSLFPSTRRTGLVSATTVGGMDYNEAHWDAISSGQVDKDTMELLDCAGSTQQIAASLGISDYVTTVSTACSSSANAIIAGARMIHSGRIDRALVGGTDSLTRFALNGFNSLEILSPTGCKPFDANRDGVTLGEGAAYLVLESSETADPDTILCELIGYANTSEAYHQTASSPDGEGAILSIRQALASAGLNPGDIDYINAHGTGTLVNDLSEGRAIETVFGNAIPPVSSTKAYTGHTLAAAGVIEAVISILAIRQSLLFPNTGFETPMLELSFAPRISLRKTEIRNVLSNSFGFGGNNASLIFSKTASDSKNRAHHCKLREKKPETPVIATTTKAYVNAFGLISPQPTTAEGDFLFNCLYDGSANCLRCIEPDYKKLIHPVQLRRISRILKLGLGAAQICLNNGGDIRPDAIVVGTGLACVNELETFLQSVLNENEQSLSPIPFINSSHNTVAAQISRMLKTQSYNNTYCHRGSSFESALVDALMLINGREAGHVLLGGIDEISEHYLTLLAGIGETVMTGEGAGFFLLGKTSNPRTYACITAAKTFYYPKSAPLPEQEICAFLDENRLSPDSIDTLVLGLNGNPDDDRIYRHWAKNVFPSASQLVSYKYLCGEYMTAGSFALALTACAIREGRFPESCLLDKALSCKPERVLILNHYRQQNYSFVLLEK
jgi:3-oxoacyl-[acyl-carrier-protein] synthase-1